MCRKPIEGTMTAAVRTTPQTFNALLDSIRAGDEHAIGIFVDRYEPMLRRVVRVTGVVRWLQSQVESQDLVQSVFIRVIAGIRNEELQFGDNAALEAYIRTVGRSRLRDHIRRQRAAKRDLRRTHAGTPGALFQLEGSTPSPSRVAEVRELVACVEGCTTPADLEVLREHVAGTGWQTLAADRGTTPEALRKRIARVRRRIRDALAD
jgi:RNA polymerase sigma factor (sigma-70 family)